MQSGAHHKTFVLSLLFCFAISNSASAANRLVINEIMINEPGSETSLEWVELYNAANDSVNLSDYRFVEATDTTHFTHHRLPAHAFVVLSRKPVSTDNSASFERQWGNASNTWGDDSLENYLLLPAKMSLRNSNDSITIIEISSGIAETVKWGTAPPDGVSLERVNPMTQSVSKNFRYCKSALLSTPGCVNSVIAKMRDWGFIENDCEIFVPADSVLPIQFQLAIGNFGQSAAVSLPCDVVLDRDFSGTLTDRDSVFQYQFGPLLPDSVLTHSLEFTVAAGRHAFIFRLASDDDSTNNTTYFECVVGPLAREMLITEFVCNSTDASGCEWIELQSVVDYDLSLQDWTLTIDDREVTLDSALQIRAAEKIIVCEDSTCFRGAFSETACQILQPDVWSALDNTSSDVVIRMQLGAVSDRVSYHGNIEPGRSWERDLDSNSAIFESQFYRSTAPEGSTPCGSNSIRPVPVALDLGFVAESLSLTKDTLNQSLIIAGVAVVNYGYLDSPPFAIRVFDDSNRDGIGQESELVLQPDLSAIAAGDSDSIEIVISSVKGRHTFIFVLPDDEVQQNDTVEATTTVGSITRELLITEFIANPEGDLESEWLEVQNVSEYSVNLQDWKFGDESHQSELNQASVILPGEYRVMAQDPAAFSRFYGANCQPLSCRNWNNLNNSGDVIIVRDEFGTVADSVTFVRVVDDNRSMELNQPPAPGLPEWNASTAESGSTPCSDNSIQPALAAVDLGFVAESLSLEKDFNDPELVYCRLILKNFGYQNTPFASVRIADDLDHDGLASESEFIAVTESPPLAPSDTASILVQLRLATGRHSLIFVLTEDDNSSNNIVASTITSGLITHELVITEFLADPTDQVESEWIEFHNVAIYPLDVAHWFCGDGTSLQELQAAVTISPGEYFVLAQDSAAFVRFYGDVCLVVSPESWSSLNNSGDIIMLRDEFGTISDSLTYFDCPGNNRSLERSEAGDQITAFWYPSTAQSGSTPCAANSVSSNYTGSTSITLLKRVFSPLAGEELRFKLDCPPASKFTIEIFDLSGRRQRILANAQYFSAGEYSYDGVSDHADHLSIGAYILKIESEDAAFSQKVGFAVAPPR